MNQEEEKNEGKQNFGSWREQTKPVDSFVSKEGFIIKNESQTHQPKADPPRAKNPNIKTPAPPPVKKTGCSKLIKILILIFLYFLSLVTFFPDKVLIC